MRSRNRTGLSTRRLGVPLIVATFVAVAAASPGAQSGFKLKSRVELVTVTATVSDDSGRFVPGLRQGDFTIYEDNEKQEITHFSAERVPVSLGILLDISGSMSPDKMESARAAINRFTQQLLEPQDELFLMTFSRSADLVQDWTTDRRAISRAMQRIEPDGGTAMYDAIAEALPIASSGSHEKKAILVISDGNDRNSTITVNELRQAIRESEVLVYALGVDSTERSMPQTAPTPRRPPQFPIPIPFPIPGGGRRYPQIFGGPYGNQGSDERVNADALRRITDDTGGRTEIVRGFRNLDEATERIADELSKQYSLAYTSTRPKDGRWHTIRVDVRDRRMTVRARRGYIAS
jgi:Ca-activated chloride channel homolog